MTELTKRILTSFFLLFILFLSFTDLKIILISLFIINFLVIDEFIKIFKKINKSSLFKQFFTIFLSILYMVYFTLTIVLFLIEAFELNKVSLLFLLIICISSDIGGYVFGKAIGGKKLTKISLLA